MYKVILAENDVAVRKNIRELLRRLDERYVLVGEAQDGEVALPIIRDMRPDILLLDMHMPFKDGMELCRDVRRDFPWVQIVLLVGGEDRVSLNEAHSLGVQDYLFKPVSRLDFDEVLNRVGNRLEDIAGRLLRVPQMFGFEIGTERYALERELVDWMEGETEVPPKGPWDEAPLCRAVRLTAMGYPADCYMAAILRWLESADDGKLFAFVSEGVLGMVVMHNSLLELEERAYSAAYALQCEARHVVGDNIRIQVGLPGHGAESLRTSNRSVQMLRERQFDRMILGTDDASVEEARLYVEQNYSNAELMVFEMAQRCGMSVSHFCLVFEQEIGRSFTGYLAHMRVRRAQELLTTSRMRVPTIARTVGYADTEFFAYVFQSITGRMPLEYRKYHAGDGSGDAVP